MITRKEWNERGWPLSKDTIYVRVNLNHSKAVSLVPAIVVTVFTIFQF